MNQSDFRPSLLRTSLPVAVTVFAVPVICTEVARPPSAPSPLRLVTRMSVSSPTPKAVAIVVPLTDWLQSWYGDAESPSSRTAGNVPPLLKPPVDELNSARTIAPAEFRSTTSAVAAMATSVRRSSIEAPFVPAPPYTWHAVVSQVLA